jgi:hypothetical protein
MQKEQETALEDNIKGVKIPEDLKEFYRKHLTILVGKTDIPKEFSNLGEGFKTQRYLFDEDLRNLSPETLIYIANHRRPDFVISNFKSGGIGTY